MSTSHHQVRRVLAVGAILAGIGLGTAGVASAATPRSSTTSSDSVRERATPTDRATSRLERERQAITRVERADAARAARAAELRLDR